MQCSSCDSKAEWIRYKWHADKKYFCRVHAIENKIRISDSTYVDWKPVKKCWSCGGWGWCDGSSPMGAPAKCNICNKDGLIKW